MKRRMVLTGIGLAIAGLSSGCLDRSVAGDDPTPDPPTTPTVDPTLTVIASGCGDGTDRAAIRFADETVHIEGVIVGSNTCETAQIESVTTTGSTLRVEIVTAVPGTGTPACAQCLTDIEYRATIDGDGFTPDEVVVIHDGTVVEQWTRSS